MFLLLCQGCGGAGGDTGVVQHQLDVALQAVSAGQLHHPGQQEGGGLLAVDALLLALPQGLLDGVRTMTANIVMEMGYATDLHREALIATAVVLFVFILMINVTFSLLRRKDRA